MDQSSLQPIHDISHPLQIRYAATGDEVKLADLMTQLGYPCTSKEMKGRLDLWLSGEQRSALFVAVKDNEIAGFIAVIISHWFHKNRPVARITSLCIDQAHRRQGIGSLLLKAAHTYAKQQGCETIELTSSVRRAQDGTHDFYRAHGYIEMNDQTKYMSKVL